MTKSERLEPVLRVAEDREQKAAKHMAESLRVTEERQRRLDELIQYREEYLGRFSATNVAPRSALQLQDFKAFLVRLDYVINEQTKLVDLSKAEYEKRKKKWLATRIKTKALDKAIDRLQISEEQLIEKKDQKNSDERAQRHQNTDVDDD